MQNNFFFLSKSCYENNYIAIDQNKINSILATTDKYKFNLRSWCRKGQGIGRKQKRDVDWGEIGYYKFSHKHIKPTHTGNLLIDAHNMTHLLGFPNFSKFRQNAIMLPQTNASHGNDFRRLVFSCSIMFYVPFFLCFFVFFSGGNTFSLKLPIFEDFLKNKNLRKICFTMVLYKDHHRMVTPNRNIFQRQYNIDPMPHNLF